MNILIIGFIRDDGSLLLRLMTRTKTVLLSQEQHDWVERKSLNFSKWVRKKVQEAIDSE